MIRLTVQDKGLVQTLRIDTEKTFIGRAPSNTIVIKDPTASRKHCMLRVRDGSVEILDLNSSHGLKVNGQEEKRALLNPGDRVSIGESEIRLEEAECAAPALSAFGGYLDDDAHLYTLRPPEESGSSKPETPPATSESEATTETPAPGPGSMFADELWVVMRRMPAWGISLIVHAAIMILLFRTPWAMAPEEETLSSINSKMVEREDLLDQTGEDEIDAHDLDLPDLEEPPPPTPDAEDTFYSEERELPPEEAASLAEDLVAPSAEALKTSVSGLGTRAKVKLGPNKSFGTGQSGSANAKASGYVMESIGGKGGRLARLLQRRPPTETVVIRGTYDRVETVLDLFQVPYTFVTTHDLRKLDLTDVKSIFVNCSNEVCPDDVAKKIAHFVNNGGYLFSTDWALENVIEKAFPRTIAPVRERRGQAKGTPDMVVEVQARLRHHFFLEGTGLEESDAEWWLEDSSYPIKIIRTDLVETLVSSRELKKRFGSGAVAVTFKWGSGRVVHVMGHYYQKKGNLRGTFAMQRIITNFLIAAIRKR
jgi:FHA domain